MFNLDYDNITEESVYEAFGVDGKEGEALNDTYLELFELVGKDAMLKLHKHYNSDKLNFPKRLYRLEFVADLVDKEIDRRERVKIARAGNYSIGTIEELISRRKKEK